MSMEDYKKAGDLYKAKTFRTIQLAYGSINEMKIVHFQSVLPQEDTIARKEKTGESSVKEAISKVVYRHLKCDDKE